MSKQFTDLMKDSAYKSPEEIDSLIEEIDLDLGAPEEKPAPSPERGGLIPQEFFTGNMMPTLESYLPVEVELSPIEKVEVVKGVQKKISGLGASMPIKCYGDRCPFKHQCPLYRIGKAPEGGDCPIEAMTLDLYTKRYLDEFEVEPDDFSEVVTMTQLAATHIMEMRGLIAIGKDDENGSPDGLIKNVVGFNNDDEPIVQIQEHPGYNIIERAWRWRMKILESLGATRREKHKLNLGNDPMADHSIGKSNADIKNMIEKMTIDITPERK